VSSLQTAEAKVSNLSIFLVEDEALIRMMTAEMIEELGYHVAIKAGTIEEAKSLAKEVDFEFAIVDINVGGQSILPVAQIVESRGYPFCSQAATERLAFRRHLPKEPCSVSRSCWKASKRRSPPHSTGTYWWRGGRALLAIRRKGTQRSAIRREAGDSRVEPASCETHSPRSHGPAADSFAKSSRCRVVTLNVVIR
jgi:CheY-like chemotaxis protein